MADHLRAGPVDFPTIACPIWGVDLSLGVGLDQTFLFSDGHTRPALLSTHVPNLGGFSCPTTFSHTGSLSIAVPTQFLPIAHVLQVLLLYERT